MTLQTSPVEETNNVGLFVHKSHQITKEEEKKKERKRRRSLCNIGIVLVSYCRGRAPKERERDRRSGSGKSSIEQPGSLAAERRGRPSI